MKHFQLTFPDAMRKITVPLEAAFIPYQNYEALGPLLGVKELTEDEFKASELADLTPKSEPKQVEAE